MSAFQDFLGISVDLIVCVCVACFLCQLLDWERGPHASSKLRRLCIVWTLRLNLSFLLLNPSNESYCLGRRLASTAGRRSTLNLKQSMDRSNARLIFNVELSLTRANHSARPDREKLETWKIPKVQNLHNPLCESISHKISRQTPQARRSTFFPKP